MKTPEKIYLVNHCEELIPALDKQFKDDVEYIREDVCKEQKNKAYKAGLEDSKPMLKRKEQIFTKEQVIELMRENRQELFNYFAEQHDLQLLNGDFQEIENILTQNKAI